jgi:hypothetical protein
MALQNPFASLSELSKSLPGDSTSPLLSFEPFKLPTSNQRELKAPHPPGTVIPLALKPARSAGHETRLPDLNEVVGTVSFLAKTGELTRLLAKHRALLFRDLPINDEDDFSKFAHAFGYLPHEIIGIVVDRPVLAPNVAPQTRQPSPRLLEVIMRVHRFPMARTPHPIW